MFSDNCPICRGRNIENNQCIRCNSDLAEIRHVEGKIAALYSSAFIAIKQEQYNIAMDVIQDLKKLRNDSFTQVMENFLTHMIVE